MNNWMFMLVLVGIMVLVIGWFAFKMAKKQKVLLEITPGYPKGYFQNQGMGLGIAIGAGIGVALENIPVGVGVGVALGVAFGASKEARHKDEIRPPTEEEKTLKKQQLVFTASILSIGLLVAILFYLLNR
ncbi:MAG: hypothetical protein K9M49_05065 [Candidatus Marinimicrobia bacterium]|nr:hypothetical protein [Candidatus Neomarinimicrobiota bacterium]MCF7904506.1 hypothetical protein [Candidatus Neomarinimicrobiota bacterium]